MIYIICMFFVCLSAFCADQESTEANVQGLQRLQGDVQEATDVDVQKSEPIEDGASSRGELYGLKDTPHKLWVAEESRARQQQWESFNRYMSGQREEDEEEEEAEPTKEPTSLVYCAIL